ncbi:MAG: LacI family DNA-binding transcriptional regulator [Kosmotogaceae bacterium]
MNRMDVNLKYIARLANVSVSTVSRALRDDPKVKEDTKQRINMIAKKLNYVPNQAAKSLITRQTKTLGLVLPNLRTFMHDIFDGIERICARNDYNILLGISDNNPYKEMKELKLLLEKRVDGIILFYVGGVYNRESLEFLSNISLPIILIDRYLPNSNFDFVVSNNEGGSRMLVDYLVSKGHERIGFIYQVEDSTTIKERLNGFTYSFIDKPISLHPEYIVADESIGVQNGYRCTERLLSLKLSPSAIVGSTGDITLGVVKYLIENPDMSEKVTVCGFDDFEFISFLRIPVTTVTQQTGKMGEKAAEIILKRINGEEFKQQKIFLNTNLFER